MDQPLTTHEINVIDMHLVELRAELLKTRAALRLAASKLREADRGLRQHDEAPYHCESSYGAEGAMAALAAVQAALANEMVRAAAAPTSPAGGQEG